MSAFCEKLTALRKAAGYTQKEVAQVLGLTRSAYAYYECGTTVPSFMTLLNIARLYGVTTDSLLDDARPITPIPRCPDPPDTSPDPER